jgi:hypothetical protein
MLEENYEVRNTGVGYISPLWQPSSLRVSYSVSETYMYKHPSFQLLQKTSILINNHNKRFTPEASLIIRARIYEQLFVSTSKQTHEVALPTFPNISQHFPTSDMLLVSL